MVSPAKAHSLSISVTILKRATCRAATVKKKTMKFRFDRRRRCLVLLSLMFAALLSGSGYANASEYGCKVLLCLASPASNGGATGVAECVPPITQLYHDLSRGHPFPSCDLADGNDGSAYANQVYDPYDPCPDPLKPATTGHYVVQGQRKLVKSSAWPSGSSSYLLSERPMKSGTSGMRACVGASVGSYMSGSYNNQDTVNVFDRVQWQKAQNPRAIDVYINNTFLQRVRW